jgi:hypothetical protein
VDGGSARASFRIPLDLDAPPHGVAPRVAGPDSVAGTGDDGRIVEDFDTDRNANGAIEIGPNPGPGAGNDCPSGSDPARCPNAAPRRTPIGGSLAYDGANSLHWGIHQDSRSTGGDNVNMRQLAAFMTTSINLTPLPRADDGSDPTYYVLTPGDGRPDPASPRGVRELLCYPRGVWSSCGKIDRFGLNDCEGPGHTGATGSGLWMRSRFDLRPYLGQKERIRWIAQSWECVERTAGR